jgi:hypothetical protein
VAGAVYGGAKAYNEELDYQAKVRDQTARDEAIFARQQEHDNARDEALYKRTQRAEEMKQEKLDKLEAANAKIYQTGAAAAREKGVNPSSAAGLRFIAEAYGNAGLQSQANKYEAAADDVQGREDAYEAKQKADILAERREDNRDRMAAAAERRAAASEARATAAASGGSEKVEPLSKVMRDTRKEIADLFVIDTGKKDMQGKTVFRDEGKDALATLDRAYAQYKSQPGVTDREAIEAARATVTSIAPYVNKAGGWDEGFKAYKTDLNPAAPANAPAPTPPPAAAPAAAPARQVVNDLPSPSTFSPGENAGRSPAPAPAAVPAPVTQTKFGQVQQNAAPARTSLSGILNAGGTDTTGSMASLFQR